MWKIEDEEQYFDIKAVEIMTRKKRGVMGEFPELLVKEKPMKFKYIKLFDGKLGIYLPEGQGDNEHIGSKYYYPSEMNEYMEYITEDNQYYITVEKLICDNTNLSEFAEEICDDIDDVYEDAIAKVTREYVENDLEIVEIFVVVTGDIDCFAWIFVIKKDEDIFRLYFSCECENKDAMAEMAYKVVENIDIV